MSMPQVILLAAEVGPVLSVPAKIEDALEELFALDSACPESSLDAGSNVMEGLGAVWEEDCPEDVPSPRADFNLSFKRARPRGVARSSG